ncbi:hypothetical protein CVT25_000717 [Psilocybe cyanescens]|uniref:Uncharacterized protein n=1 Tax=Psilocybe cyanescens TaxID=93625 RepID=A0A409XAX9_PSICY|nr:hypothetical protein CVT25_000717 [Psilocybe cyanescens]
MEQAPEEAEAPLMTEEQRQLLMQPFATVKAEFADLDGLRWTQTALSKLQPRSAAARLASPSTPGTVPRPLLAPCLQPRSAAARLASPSSNANGNVNGTAHTTINSNSNKFVVLTYADLASFSVDDTIRVSSSSSSSCLPFPPSMFSPSPSSHPLSATLPPPLPPPDPPYRIETSPACSPPSKSQSHGLGLAGGDGSERGAFLAGIKPPHHLPLPLTPSGLRISDDAMRGLGVDEDECEDPDEDGDDEHEDEDEDYEDGD